MATAYARNQQENLPLRGGLVKAFCPEYMESPSLPQCSSEAPGFPSREYLSICGGLRSPFLESLRRRPRPLWAPCRNWRAAAAPCRILRDRNSSAWLRLPPPAPPRYPPHSPPVS